MQWSVQLWQSYSLNFLLWILGAGYDWGEGICCCMVSFLSVSSASPTIWHVSFNSSNPSAGEPTSSMVWKSTKLKILAAIIRFQQLRTKHTGSNNFTACSDLWRLHHTALFLYSYSQVYTRFQAAVLSPPVNASASSPLSPSKWPEEPKHEFKSINRATQLKWILIKLIIFVFIA